MYILWKYKSVSEHDFAVKTFPNVCKMPKSCKRVASGLDGFLNSVADLSARIASENRRIEMYIDTKFMGVGWCWVSSVEVQRR